MYIIGDSRSTKSVQMMVVGWPLTFLRQGQICAPLPHPHPQHTFVWENVEKSVSQYVLKTNGWHLQRMIKETKLFSYRYLPFLLGYIHVLNREIFKRRHRFHMGSSVERMLTIDPMVPRHWTRWPLCHYMVKSLKNLLLQYQKNLRLILVHRGLTVY